MPDHEVVRMGVPPGLLDRREDLEYLDAASAWTLSRRTSKIGGQVDIQSQIGEGTTLKIKIPLTLAIIPALIVGGDSERYAIPQVSLLELVQLEGAPRRAPDRTGARVPFYRLRGSLLPAH